MWLYISETWEGGCYRWLLNKSFSNEKPEQRDEADVIFRE